MNKGTKRSAHADLFGSRELARHTRCVVIVAHPDDDVVGAGGLISRLDDVTVLHVTDGIPKTEPIPDAAAGENSESAHALRRESRTALALANVSGEQIIEFGLGTEQAPFELTNLTRRIASFLMQLAPDIVLTNPYEGGDPDHDATAFATHAALRLLQQSGFKPPSVFEIAMYPTPDGNKRVLDFFLPSEPAEVTTLLLDKKARELKRQMFACFTTRPDLQRENSFGRERFRRPPRYNFAAPPNGGKLNYERVAPGVEVVEWQELVRKAWSELFPGEPKSHHATSHS